MTLFAIRTAAAALLSAFLVLGLSAADAASFRLGDHPEGAFADAPDNQSYGLRLDSLNPGSPDGDDEEFFSFEENGAEAYLFWDGVNGSMTGTMWQNSGGPNALFALSYTFGGEVANGMGFTATSGSGTLTRIGGDGQVINLGFEQDSIGRAFLFLFDGHRLPGDNSSPVGRGWVTANGLGGNYNDFLFTAAPVPLPAAAWLFISGLLGFGFWKRRQAAA